MNPLYENHRSTEGNSKIYRANIAAESDRTLTLIAGLEDVTVGDLIIEGIGRVIEDRGKPGGLADRMEEIVIRARSGEPLSQILASL